MKIGVVGAGAMGSLFGARLAEAGVADVVLLDVNKPHIAAIREKGLLFEDGPETRRVRIRATPILSRPARSISSSSSANTRTASKRSVTRRLC
jgi:2-dehydropantoate 2-reductase